MYEKIFEKLLIHIRNLPINKLVFWIGAGIDADKPTALPLGNGLMIEILKLACGSDVQEKLLKAWKINSLAISQITNGKINISEYPRLETILEAIHSFEDNLLKPGTVIGGLQSFQDALPNQNHYILATMLHMGANIVTTNYDACISKAYQNLYGERGFYLSLKYDGEGLYTYQSDHEGAGMVYHIHGVAQSILDIGATLSKVKNPITKRFDNLICNWINNDNCFIFLGYGGVDAFDVNPYFKSKSKFKKSLGIYIRHNMSYDDKEDDIIQGNDKESNLINCFSKSFVLYTNTNKFLNLFSKVSNTNESIYEWKNNFNKYCTFYDDEMKELCILSILNILGLDPQNVLEEKWSSKYINYIDKRIVNNWYLGYYGFNICIRCGENKLAKQFVSILPKGPLLEIDKRANKENFFYVLSDLKFINSAKERLEECIIEDKLIDWNVSTPLNRSIYYIIKFIQQSPLNLNICIKIMNKKAIEIKKLLEQVIEKGFLNVLDINQMNVAYIDLGVIEQIFYKNSKKAKAYFDLALNNYSEVCSVSGIINVLIYQAICYEFEYYENNNPEYENEVIYIYNQINNIVAHTNYWEKYKKMLKIIENLGIKMGIYVK